MPVTLALNVLAASTLRRISSDDSACGRSYISVTGNQGTSRCRSIRSSSGPDNFDRYFWICCGVQMHSRWSREP